MSDKSLLDALEKASKSFGEAMKEIENQEESWWNSLTEEERISAFCCVSRRIYTGDVEENRTYRGVLYDVCGFGPNCYYQPSNPGSYPNIPNRVCVGP